MNGTQVYLPEQVLPHRAPMLLLKEVLSCSDSAIQCKFMHVPEDAFTDAHGRRPAWVGIEYMCQAIAALEGTLRLRENETIKPSFVIGSKRVSVKEPYLLPNQEFLVNVETQMRDDAMFGAYSTEVLLDGRCIMSAIIKGVMIENPEEIWGKSF